MVSKPTRQSAPSMPLGVLGVVFFIGSVSVLLLSLQNWQFAAATSNSLQFVLLGGSSVGAFLSFIISLRGLYSSFYSQVVLELGSIMLGVFFAILGGYFLFMGLIVGRSLGDVLLGATLFGTAIVFYFIGFLTLWVIGASEELERFAAET